MSASITDFIPFSQIIGQERAISFLKQVISQEKIPHAYLFVGIPGIGKTTTAIALTRAMNCQESTPGEGCGRCQPCRQINSGNFPDLEFVEPDGQNIKIEQIRNLDRTLAFKPLSGRYRVSIIRQAEAMTQEAANAFLKTLEEPPPGNMLILNVTEPLDLLSTIVSRCQKVAFRPIPARLIQAWLKDRKGLDEGKASILAKLSDGSLGRAIEMCEGDFLAKRQESLTTLSESLRLSPDEVFEMVLEYTGKDKRKESEPGKRGKWAVSDLLGIWKTWYRDLLVIKTTGLDDMLINTDFSAELKNSSKDFTISSLIDSFLLIDQAESDYMRTRNVDLMMENLVLKLKNAKSQGKTFNEEAFSKQ